MQILPIFISINRSTCCKIDFRTQVPTITVNFHHDFLTTPKRHSPFDPGSNVDFALLQQSVLVNEAFHFFVPVFTIRFITSSPLGAACE